LIVKWSSFFGSCHNIGLAKLTTGVVLKKITIKRQQQMMQDQQNRQQQQQQQQQHHQRQHSHVQWQGQQWVRIPTSNFLTVPQPSFFHPTLFDPGCSYMVSVPISTTK